MEQASNDPTPPQELGSAVWIIRFANYYFEMVLLSFAFVFVFRQELPRWSVFVTVPITVLRLAHSFARAAHRVPTNRERMRFSLFGTLAVTVISLSAFLIVVLVRGGFDLLAVYLAIAQSALAKDFSRGVFAMASAPFLVWVMIYFGIGPATRASLKRLNSRKSAIKNLEGE
jgi:hypothetical protein